jgi:hypothetical protein
VAAVWSAAACIQSPRLAGVVDWPDRRCTSGRILSVVVGSVSL